MTLPITPSFKALPRTFTLWDFVAALLVLGALVLLAQGSRGLMQALPEPGVGAITLDPSALPEYALLTSLRMLAAMALSLLFTFTYATLAAKSRRSTNFSGRQDLADAETRRGWRAATSGSRRMGGSLPVSTPINANGSSPGVF